MRALTPLSAVVFFVLAVPSGAAAPRDQRLGAIHSWAFAIGDGDLSGDVRIRYAPFDLVVVDGEGANVRQVRALRGAGKLVLAYLDVGTIERGRWWYRLATRYRLDLWRDWGEWYANVARRAYRRLIAGRVAPAILAKGFDGLFLDNTDMVETHGGQTAGMGMLVRSLARLVHDHRGYLFTQNGEDSIGPTVANYDGWNREDVTWRYDFDRHRYVHQPADTVRAAQRALRRIAARGLLVTATDYTPAGNEAAGAETRANACAAGALPFASDIGLRRIGSARTCIRPPGVPAGVASPRCWLKVVPPARGAYLSAFPDFVIGQRNEDGVSGRLLRDYERVAGRPVAWAYFSQHWFRGLSFPDAAVRAIWSQGVVPFVRLMPWSRQQEYRQERQFTLARIAAGVFDGPLARWARTAASAGIPLMVEFGTEVNGDWFPWNGRYNGGPGVGPARFRAAFRHVVQLFRANGARNITWAFHLDAAGAPGAAWNRFESYYPGDRYVDWVGISAYGAQQATDDWKSFTRALGEAYARAARMTRRPLAILETAVTEQPGHDKAAWIRAAFAAIASGRYPLIKAVSWWDEQFPNDHGPPSDLRINSHPESLAAFRQATASPYFVTQARVARRCQAEPRKTPVSHP